MQRSNALRPRITELYVPNLFPHGRRGQIQPRRQCRFAGALLCPTRGKLNQENYMCVPALDYDHRRATRVAGRVVQFVGKRNLVFVRWFSLCLGRYLSQQFPKMNLWARVFNDENVGCNCFRFVSNMCVEVCCSVSANSNQAAPKSQPEISSRASASAARRARRVRNNASGGAICGRWGRNARSR